MCIRDSNIAELFKESENVAFAVKVTETMTNLYANNKDIMRIHWYSPNKVLPRLKDLQLERRNFFANNYQQNNAAPVSYTHLCHLLLQDRIKTADMKFYQDTGE